MKHALADDPSGSEDERNSPSSSRSDNAPKRARLDVEEEPESSEGEGSADEGSDEAMDEGEEDRAEQEAAAIASEARRLKNTTNKGVIAQAGVVESVELKNFMCHRHVTVVFGPQLNFLIGHNGSGKSAVLTGLSIALGSSAKATNRGETNKDLVRQGESFAICSVRLKNKGPDAYKPALYGNSITVERRISKDGPSSYKIKDHNGRTVETKKAVLDDILYSFNIQIENPLTILSQDQSRAFLGNSSATEKYAFWLKGTQLAQLTDEYEVIRSNTETMQELLDKKREVVPEIKEAFRQAKAKAKDAEAALQQRDRLVEFKNLLAWTYVSEVEEQIEKAQAEIQAASSKIAKLEKEMANVQIEVDQADQGRMEIEEAIAELNQEGEGRRAELEALKATLDQHKKVQLDYQAELRQVNAEIQQLRATIAGYEADIVAEQAKLARDVAAERVPIERKIEENMAENKRLLAVQDEAAQRHTELEDRRRTLKDKYNALGEKHSAMQSAMKKSEGRLNTYRSGNRDPLAAYTDKMAKLVQAVNADRGWQQKPIGPIGRSVQLKDTKYSSVLDAFLGDTLNAFIVTNNADRERLFKIQRNLNAQSHTPIILQRQDGERFYTDLANNEPAPDVLTMRRNLQFAHPLVEQALITARSIEVHALVPQRAQGDEMFRQKTRNILNCFSADMFRVFQRGGAMTSFKVDPWLQGSRLTADNSEAIRREQIEIESLGRQMNQIHHEMTELDQEIKSIVGQMKRAEAERRSAGSQMGRLNDEINRLNAQLREEEPSKLADLQNLKAESERDLEMLLAQAVAIAENKPEDSKELVQRKQDLEKEEKIKAKMHAKLAEQQRGFASARLKAHDKLVQFEQRHAAINAQVEAKSAEHDELQAKLDACIAQAQAICEERPPNPKKKSSAKIIQDIQSLEAALERGDRLRGATIEELFEEMNIRRIACDKAIKVVNDLAMLTKVLNKAYDERITRWNNFRQMMAHRAAVQFVRHLETRGFTGRLTFDHNHLELSMIVNTSEDAAKVERETQTQKRIKGKKARKAENQRIKDKTKSLSGGEKSYSTICLLLSMWDLAGSPVRCLDEFDVFMDPVNRRISMNMIIEHARAADSAQHVLITPLDIANVVHGPEVRISRMHDPGRNAGTLGFGITA